MTLTRPHRLRLSAALAGVLIAACAPARQAPEPVSAFPRQAVEEVFTAGYGSIKEKYIDPVVIGELALEGLHGLGSIDPNLSVERDGGEVVLSAGERPVARFLAPRESDVQGWAELTSRVSAAGRLNSADLRRASPELLYQAVFDGVLSHLDAFSRYAGTEKAKKNRAKRDGYGGIGIDFKVRDGAAWVTKVKPKTPAARAGLKRNDRITHVGGNSIEGLGTREVRDWLRGPVHSQVTLIILREGAPKSLVFVIERSKIIPPTVTYGYEDGIVFLKITGFNQRTAGSMADRLKGARHTRGDGIKGLILDLRGNPGGLLKQSIKVVDLFLSQGNIVMTRGRHPDSNQHYVAKDKNLAAGIPVAILVDGKSASAAEIVAAALQDRGRAVVIGTSSFGKGTVQTVIRLPNDGEITLTWSRLIPPSGYILHDVGVLPTICTSGVSGKGRDLISRAIEQRLEVEAAWRKAGSGDDERRKDLRASCPSERRRDSFDVEVARRLLVDRVLYARALSLSAANTAARY